MKILLLLLGAAAAVVVLGAQADSAGPTNAAPATLNFGPGLVTGDLPGAARSAGQTNSRAPTEIFSDSAEFDLKTRVAVYLGNVRVLDPQMKMLCEVLTVIVPEGGDRIDHITAETNVVIDAQDDQGQPIHATGQKAVYTYKVENSVTNEMLELTGDPYVESKSAHGFAEKIVWDRGQNKIHMYKQRSVLIQPPARETATNAPPRPPAPQ